MEPVDGFMRRRLRKRDRWADEFDAFQEEKALLDVDWEDDDDVRPFKKKKTVDGDDVSDSS